MQNSIDLDHHSPNYPVLFEDETLYSWCGRFHGRNGFGAVPRTSMALFGDPHAGRMHDFPGHLNSFAERTSKAIGSASELQTNNTLLGFFLPFLDLPRATTLQHALREGRFSQAKMWLGLPASRLGGELPLKQCPLCAEEDTLIKGIAYWHVSHQHPAALVCHKHGINLLFAESAIAPVKNREWIQIRNVATWHQVPKISETHRAELQRIACFAAATRHVPAAGLSPAVIRSRLQSRLHSMSHLTSAGSVRHLQVQTTHHDYSRRMNELFADIPRFGVRLNLERCFGLMCSGRMRAAHPLRRVLVLSSYFENVTELLNYADDFVRPMISDAVRKPYPAEDRTRTSFYDLLQEGLSIRAASKASKISTTTGVQWARIAGRPYTQRSKSISDEVRSAVFERLKRGESKETIRVALGVGVVSLNRIIGSDLLIAEQWRQAQFAIELRRYRQRFQTLISEHPGVPLKHLRRIPDNGYAWLYRNDREWLTANLPALWLATRTT